MWELACHHFTTSVSLSTLCSTVLRYHLTSTPQFLMLFPFLSSDLRWWLKSDKTELLAVAVCDFMHGCSCSVLCWLACQVMLCLFKLNVRYIYNLVKNHALFPQRSSMLCLANSWLLQYLPLAPWPAPWPAPSHNPKPSLCNQAWSIDGALLLLLESINK